MPKLLGVREVVGHGFLSPGLLGIGHYEAAHYEAMGAMERRHSPYEIGALGQTKEPYDLNQPGSVAEIKRVLIALAQRQSDPLRNPDDPATEDLWKYIDTDKAFLDAWDGPTADEFILATSRYRDLTDGPHAQLVEIQGASGTRSIVGGPQPTVRGLELLAKASHKYLADTPQLTTYLGWRGGDIGSFFDMLTGGAPEAAATPSHQTGRAWNPRGWTIAWKDGPVAVARPELLSDLNLMEESLKTAWLAGQQEPDEKSRLVRAKALTELRRQRHDLVIQLNKGAVVPSCPGEQVWSGVHGACIARCPPGQKWEPAEDICVVQLPPIDIVEPAPTASMSKMGLYLGVGAMVVVAAYFGMRPAKAPRSRSTAAWTMG